MPQHKNIVGPSRRHDDASHARRYDDASHGERANDLDNQILTSKHATIVMVDDEPTIIETLQMFLEDVGYDNFVATTESQRAMGLLADKKPDVVLLDLMMPEISGLEILSRMRSDDAFKHIPVIILTSVTDSETKMNALELGVNDFLSKPVDPSELALRLRNTLAAKAYQDRLMFYDGVTDLPNRRMFLERLAAGLKRAKHESRPCAILQIGLDRFKQINDTLGPSVGDALLRAVAVRLIECIRKTDVLGRSLPLGDDEGHLSRVGGDEFILCLPGIRRLEDTALVARRILAALTKAFHTDAREVFITASIGIAAYPTDGDDVDVLIQHADVALAHAKQRERGTYQYYSKELNARSLERLDLENQLRKAIDQQQLFLHFQPKYEVKTGRVTGAEALMRWNHPELGIVPPGTFIPMAEEMDLITLFGEWALHEVCALNKQWQSSGMEPVRVAVNVSARQFRDTDRFKQAIRNALESSGLEGKYLALELTEGTIMANPQEVCHTLKEIKEMGVELSIDDFGTGYSSLAYLRRFPLDEIKVDRTFLRDIPQNEDDAAIVTAIIVLAHSLGLRVVTEGVETEGQLAFLKERGCDEYQGFLSSKPLKPPDFLALVMKVKTG